MKNNLSITYLLTLIVIGVYLRWTNPELTLVEFYLKYWQFHLISICSAIIAWYFLVKKKIIWPLQN